MCVFNLRVIRLSKVPLFFGGREYRLQEKSTAPENRTGRTAKSTTVDGRNPAPVDM